MLLATRHVRLSLADDEIAHLHDARDSRMDITSGLVWVTVDGERGDVVLGAGDSYLVDSADAVTVSALRGAASVELRAPAGMARPAKGRALRGQGRQQQTLARLALSSVAVD